MILPTNISFTLYQNESKNSNMISALFARRSEGHGLKDKHSYEQEIKKRTAIRPKNWSRRIGLHVNQHIYHSTGLANADRDSRLHDAINTRASFALSSRALIQ